MGSGAAASSAAGKKVNGRKRHFAVDVEGVPLVMEVHPADIQDRDGAVGVLSKEQEPYPTVELVWADSGFGGVKLRNGLDAVQRAIMVEVAEKSAEGFLVLPRRWVVERTFAWLNRCRRLSKDFERRIESTLA